MSITEDKLASSIIKHFRESTKRLEEMDNTNIELNVHPESSYNHYGTRGFVDLYFERKYPSGYSEAYVYELKSESAVKQATGANEIIRQFNKMREYFFKGSSHSLPKSITFELCFTPTEYNIRHISENIEMYHSSVEQRLLESYHERINRIVTSRPPNVDDITPIIFANPSFTLLKEDNFCDYVEGANHIIHNEHKELIKEIDEKFSA